MGQEGVSETRLVLAKRNDMSSICRVSRGYIVNKSSI